MRQVLVTAVSAAALVSGVAACGGGSSYDKQTAAIDFAFEDTTIALDELTTSDLGDDTAEIKDTNKYVALVEKYRKRGMSKTDAIHQLEHAISEVSACPACQTILDRERQDILGGAG